MAKPLVILHGWSATEKGFRPLAQHLQGSLKSEVTIIQLADYLSMEDEVRFDDLASAMNRAWDDHRLPRDKRSVNAVVHSTGGLVIRHWLDRYCNPERAPIHHLVMLAPANFGSPLAHKGRSFLARLYKGAIAKRPQGRPFETGTRILKSLELASPYTWDLAQRDRFGTGSRVYEPGNVICTVLVGNRGYEGVKSIWNEDGSDGTVRVSTANMNCVRTTARLSRPTDDVNVEQSVEWERPEPSSGLTAFGIADGHDHTSIRLPKRTLRSNRDRNLLGDILNGLTVEDDAFDEWCVALERRNDSILASQLGGTGRRHGFQNMVVHVKDQYGADVDDFVLEFYEKDSDRTGGDFHGTSIKGVHKHSDEPSYRSVYINCTRLAAVVDKVGEYLSMRVTAHPDLDSTHAYAGFRTSGQEEVSLRIEKNQISAFFAPHRTALVTIVLHRVQEEDLFRFKKHSEA